MVHKQKGYFLYVCTKFEADCSIRSKVIKRSQNFEIRSRDPGRAHLGEILWSARRKGRHLCLCKIWSAYLYSFQSYKGGPKISKFGQVTQATPILVSFYDPDLVGVRDLCMCQIWSGYLYWYKSYKAGPKISKFGHVTQATPN